MPTSRERSAAARLAKLHPDEAYQAELAMTVPERRALYADLRKREYFRLYCDITVRRMVDALNAAVLEDLADLARRAPQLERERVARLAARKAAQQ